jgi:hypothetical protein
MAPDERSMDERRSTDVMFRHIQEGIDELKHTQGKCTERCDREMSMVWDRIRSLEDYRSGQEGREAVRKEQREREMEETQRQQTKAIILAAILTGIITLLGTVMIHLITRDPVLPSARTAVEKSTGGRDAALPAGATKPASPKRGVLEAKD